MYTGSQLVQRQRCFALMYYPLALPRRLAYGSPSIPSLSRIMQSAHLLGLTRIGLYCGGDMSLMQAFDLHPIEMSE